MSLKKQRQKHFLKISNPKTFKHQKHLEPENIKMPSSQEKIREHAHHAIFSNECKTVYMQLLGGSWHNLF